MFRCGVLTARSAANQVIRHTSDFTVNSTTYTAGVYTEASCEADGGAWVTKGWCSGGDTTTDTLQYLVQNIGCTEPTEGWTTQYKGMAYLDKENKQLTLKSATDELVADMWLVSDELYYTAYSTGSYLFVKEVANTTNPTLLNNFEVYHVTSSPRGGGRVLFDGLNFSDNSYTFGDLDPSADDVAGSISQSSGLTGRVQTMVTYD